jgi:hypothetical protein
MPLAGSNSFRASQGYLMNTIKRPLDVLQVDNPCTADWQLMPGDDRVRFCDHCQRQVHNLSAMTEDEAVRLVCAQAGELCVRFSRDPKGRTATLNYQPTHDGAKRGWRFWSALGAGGAIASWFFSAVAGIPGRNTFLGGSVQGEIRCMTQPVQLPSTTLPTTAPGCTRPSDDDGGGPPQ